MMAPLVTRPCAPHKGQTTAPASLFSLPLLSYLPARLADLPPYAHARVGRALDAGRVQLVLSNRGEILVQRARP
jgi:hypothetical protein